MNWKELYLEWLRAAKASAEAKKTSPYLVQAYDRAIDSLENSELETVESPQELKSLKYFGDKTIAMLTKKTVQYCKKNKLAVPSSLEDQSPLNVLASRQPSKVSKSRNYVPKYNSIGCHALIGLRLLEFESVGGAQGVGRTELSRLIRSRLVESNDGKMMPTLTPALSTLIRNELIYSHNSRYFLEDQGRVMADGFLRAQGKFPSSQSASAGTDSLTSSSVQLDSQDIHNRIEPHEYHKETWEAGEFEIKLILDNREVSDARHRNGFMEELIAQNVPVDQLNLSVGDVLWVAENKRTKRRAVLEYIVERKTLQDLKMSIHDGRHQEQKIRLAKSTIPHIVYLIEFEQSPSNRELFKEQKQKFQTTLSQTIVLNGFRLKITNGQSDTVRYLAQFTRLIEEQYERTPVEVIVPHVETFTSSMRRARAEIPSVIGIDYDSFCEGVAKTKFKTVGEIFRAMLTTVKGISPEKALVIQQMYQTPRLLYTSYQNLPEEERSAMIFNATKNNIQRRRIKPEISELLYSIWGPKVA